MSIQQNPAATPAAMPDGTSTSRRIRRVTAVRKADDPTGALAASERGYGSATLRLGVYGDDVRLLQTQLLALGYTLDVDSEYSTTTRNAVCAFQRDHGLSPNGIAGPMTITTAISALGLLRSAPGTPIPQRRMDTGMSGRPLRARSHALTAAA